MSIRDELKKEGYVYQYGRDLGAGDRKEVWLNEKERCAIFVEWVRLEKVIP